MIFKPFYEYFPEIAKQETRVINVSNSLVLPDAEYGFVELYCSTINCDCRRVILNVMSPQTTEPMAVIGYGWESKKYYAKWLKINDSVLIDEMKGPELNVGSPQSPYAQELLKLFGILLEDKSYVQRLKRHYTLLKESIKLEHKNDNIKNSLSPKKLKVGRNQLCPCGSGRKYKKCCIGIH